MDASGSDVAIAGISLRVELAGGAGGLSGTTLRTTDGGGRASFTGLELTGAAVGVRSLLFEAAGLASAASTEIDVTAGAPASVEVASSQDQLGQPDSAVAEPPAVLVRDLDQNPVPGARVDFAVVSGGGVVEGTPATTGTDGVARIERWTLGASGPQAVSATAAALPDSPVTFSASARAPADAYDITLEFLTEVTSTERDAFLRARARIEQIVTGDLPAIFIPSGNTCGGATFTGTSVDDLYIVVEVRPIDGLGKVLARAGPCYVRATGQLPVAGMMQFDSDDMPGMVTQGQLDAVVLHEMLHVLGFGTMWPVVGILSGAETADPLFDGLAARDAFLYSNGGTSWGGDPVPVENTGGSGTIHSHWREIVFGRELMTGWLSGTEQPMSATTVQSLADLGYEVDASRADAFDLTAAALRMEAFVPALDLANDQLPVTIREIDEQGRTRPVAP